MSVNESGRGDIDAVLGKMSEVKDTMAENISRVIDRGEKLDDMINKTEGLRTSAAAFSRSSRQLRTRMYWSNVKMWCIGVAIVLVVLLIVFFAACNGLMCVQRR